ncbi:hypothetical protein VA596_41685 [Amycolatopsis sp., V23-08]|uniref:Uncharacterized protein n=1 Tax=Amycolatopsis heterodermiae TaxID=3110235 RepID=A0ABU5RKK8_9PSEU|nr:hypothetical protein [Amycolatopsis sp., V23-08]MEA5366099.1 hypothetical protein [Amycolatopsis sp., V23-08]
MGIRYATREDVKDALDSAETARNNTKIDAALDTATDTITGLCHRTFYPELKTVAFDWPDPQSPTSWRLWLEQHELIEPITVTAGGVTLAVDGLKLYPQSGPPYDRIETDLSGAAVFGSGSTTQQTIEIYGLFGHRNDEATAAALTAAVPNATATAVDVTDGSQVGVGSVLRIGTERLVVTGRRQLDTGQTITDDLAAQNNLTGLKVGDGDAFAIGEVVLVDTERMLIVDIAADTLIVKRAWDGTVLAGHTTGATVYSPRRLLVDRGVLGTTAAAHGNADTVTAWQPPGAVRELAVAEALTTLGQKASGYARTIGTGESEREALGKGIDSLRRQVYRAFGRKGRIRVVAR